MQGGSKTIYPDQEVENEDKNVSSNNLGKTLDDRGNIVSFNKNISNETEFADEIIKDFNYDEYFKTDEGSEKLKEISLKAADYFKKDMPKIKKSIIHEDLINKKKELEKTIKKRIEFDQDGGIYVSSDGFKEKVFEGKHEEEN